MLPHKMHILSCHANSNNFDTCRDRLFLPAQADLKLEKQLSGFGKLKGLKIYLMLIYIMSQTTQSATYVYFHMAFKMLQ